MHDRAGTLASSLEGRHVVITGANTGIGKETARALARRGASLVLACRSEDKTRPVIQEIARETGNNKIHFVPLDLGELASVRRAAEAILARGEPIHVLINNAGLAGQRGVTKDGFEQTFGVNHLGHYLFTRLLLDAIEKSAPARIVHVASKAHYRAKRIDFDALRRPTATTTGVPEYGVSKLCNVLFSSELARRLEGKQVTSNALHPGVIASDVWREIPWPFRGVMKLFMKSNEEGARTSLYCATAPELEGVTGRYYDDEKEREPSALGRDEELARELWERSAEWAGLT